MPRLVKAEDRIALASVRIAPKAYALVLRAFNEGWKVIAARAGYQDSGIAGTRLELANAVLELADSIHDANGLKVAALRSIGRSPKRTLHPSDRSALQHNIRAGVVSK